jgi:O-antigen/teichoic acid export membrane protein
MAQDTCTLTGGRLLARNSLANLVGQGAPLIVAFVTIPLLIKALGTERFGVLNLVWMVIGYFSLFDMGLSRAITKLVAEKLGGRTFEEIPALIFTGIALMVVLGVGGGLIAAAITPWLVHSALKIPAALQDETLKTFYLLALSLPLVISTAGLRGVLEAYQRFDLVNYIRLPMGLFSYLGPLLAVPFANDLVTVVAVLLAGRLIAWGVHLRLCLRLVPELRTVQPLRRSAVRSLLIFGGWMTVTNIIGPLMVSLDRFLLGTLVSVTAVAYYATPYEMVTRLWIIPTALTGVLFPAFSASFAQDRDRCRRLYQRSIKYTFLSLFPLVLLTVAFAGEGMTLWLGKEFAGHSFRALQWLAAGVFVNSLSFIPFSLISGCGRPDITSKLHLVELPVYLGVAWLLAGRYGIDGMAMAWTLRVVMDNLLLFWIAGRFLPDAGTFGRFTLLTVVLPLGLFALAASLVGFAAKISFSVLVLALFAVVAWRSLLVRDERILVCKCLRFNHS